MYEPILKNNSYKEDNKSKELSLHMGNCIQLQTLTAVSGNAAGLRQAGLLNCDGIIQRGVSAAALHAEAANEAVPVGINNLTELKTGNNISKHHIGIVKILLNEYSYERGKKVAELHVLSKEPGQKSTLPKNIYDAFQFCLSDPDVILFWMNPTGVQVVKGIVEILGQAVGERELVSQANEARDRRRSTHIHMRSDGIIDSAVVPEHELYLRSLYGTQGLIIRSRALEGEGQFIDMMEDEDALSRHIEALNNFNGKAASLNITFSREIAQALVGHLKKLGADK